MSTHNSISNTEFEVLKELWADRRASVRLVHERLKARGNTWAYNTVQTLLNRLCTKGFVQAERRSRAVEYTVVVTREDLVRQQLDGIANRMCAGSPTPLILSLFEGGEFSSDDLREFRRLLDDLEAGEEGSRATP